MSKKNRANKEWKRSLVIKDLERRFAEINILSESGVFGDPRLSGKNNFISLNYAEAHEMIMLFIILGEISVSTVSWSLKSKRSFNLQLFLSNQQVLLFLFNSFFNGEILFLSFSSFKIPKKNQIYLASENFSRKRQKKTQKNQQAGFSAERCLCVRARERHMHHRDSRFFELRSPHFRKNAASRSFSNTKEILFSIFRFKCAFSAISHFYLLKSYFDKKT